MRVDQNATTVPTTPGPTPSQLAKEEARAQTVVVQPQSRATPPADGLQISISDAGRQAANSPSPANNTSSLAGASVSATQAPIRYSLMEGVPWPVGLGPPAWPETQGAVGVNKLIAAQVPQVPQHNPAVSKAPSGVEIATEAAQAKSVPETAAQVQASVGGASPPNQRDARHAATSTEPSKTGSAYAGDAARVPAQKQKLNLQA